MKIFISFFFICTVFGQNEFNLNIIKNAKQRLALCNDQTPAGFYVRKGSTNNWVIRIQGGGWCYDLPSCMDRWKNSEYWMTNKYLPATMNDTYSIGPAQHGGILSSNMTTNPYFYNANHVYIWYCSSDSHLGTKDPSPAFNNWAFYGKNIIKAVMEDMLDLADPKFSLAENVLITGDSAGGVGALNNIDLMVQTLKPYVSKTTKFAGFIDAGWFLDIPTFQNTTTSFQTIARKLRENWNVIYDQSCMDAFQPSGNEWKCFHAQYLQPYLSTPCIYHEFLYDSANLGFDGAGKPWDQAKQDYVNQFRIEVTADTAKISNIFSPACYLHEVEDTKMINSISVNGKTFANVLGEWFFNGAEYQRYVDTCATVDCNVDC